MKVCVLYVVLVMTGLPLRAQVITLSDTLQKQPVTYPYYREDRWGSLSFEEVVQSPDAFTRSSIPVPDFMGNLSKAIWYRFDVANNSAVNQWFLEIKGGSPDHSLPASSRRGRRLHDAECRSGF